MKIIKVIKKSDAINTELGRELKKLGWNVSEKGGEIEVELKDSYEGYFAEGYSRMRSKEVDFYVFMSVQPKNGVILVDMDDYNDEGGMEYTPDIKPVKVKSTGDVKKDAAEVSKVLKKAKQTLRRLCKDLEDEAADYRDEMGGGEDEIF